MVNPLGAVVIFDGETPRSFTALTRTVISGGQLVVVSGAAAVVSSGASSYTADDIVVDIIADSDHCNGIALQNAGSNTYVAVATRGSFLMRSAGVISGGVQVIPYSGTSQGVALYGAVGSPNYALTGTPIGRVQTASASGTDLYCLVALNC